VLAWVDEMSSDDRPVGLLGFCQGGALALELLRHQPLRFAYAGQICGFRLPGPRTDSVDLQRRRPPTFSALGGRDDVIARAESTAMTDWLREVALATLDGDGRGTHTAGSGRCKIESTAQAVARELTRRPAPSSSQRVRGASKD
jgi:dienelactone hydrolase